MKATKENTIWVLNAGGGYSCIWVKSGEIHHRFFWTMEEISLFAQESTLDISA